MIIRWSWRAVLRGSSSCMQWPTLANTFNRKRPYMLAIVKSLSILSFSANNNSLGIFTLRNCWVSPKNQSFQYCLDCIRSTLHLYTGREEDRLLSSFIIWPGTDTLADFIFLIVLDLTDHWTHSSTVLNYLGLLSMMASIKGRASMAVPSTTSITTRP